MVPSTSHKFRRTAGRVLPVLVLWTCGMLAETIDAQYLAQVEQWRQQPEAGLKADGGWLTVTDLFWLKDGDNTIGSDPSNDILLPQDRLPVWAPSKLNQAAPLSLRPAPG
jgi:uncharacterized protein